MCTPYQERVRTTGSASQLTVYGSKVSNGKILIVHTLSAAVYTSAIGDYTTAKFIFLGGEINGAKHYIRGRDIAAASWTAWAQIDMVLKEGDRPFAEYEAIAATETYEFVINGVLFDEEEYCKQFHKVESPK